jgi:hypothetical protein
MTSGAKPRTQASRPRALEKVTPVRVVTARTSDQGARNKRSRAEQAARLLFWLPARPRSRWRHAIKKRESQLSCKRRSIVGARLLAYTTGRLHALLACHATVILRLSFQSRFFGPAMSTKKFTRLAAVFLVFLLVPILLYSDDPILLAMIYIGAFALFVAAVGLLAWIFNRQDRANFVASLSEAEHLGLWAHEALNGWDSWRDYDAMIERDRAAKAKSRMHRPR